jgi:hypothetical protein
MSQSDYLAHLEASARANTAKIQRLNEEHARLAHQNQEQQDFISRFENELGVHTNEASSSSDPSSRYAHPGPRPTHFYIAARSAQQLKLNFTIEGMQGEALSIPVRTVDLAFLLQQRLQKHAWSDERIHQSVLGFLDTPVVSVEWKGKEGEYGLLKDA